MGSRTSKTLALVLLGFLSSSLICGAQRKQDERSAFVNLRKLALQFYPSELVDPASPDSGPYCKAVYATNKAGEPTTIFVNYLDKQGKFLVIQRKPGGGYWAKPVAPSATDAGPDGDGFGQVSCMIQFVTISADVRRAVVLNLYGMAGDSSDWVFAWNGESAKNMTPTYNLGGEYDPIFGDVGFVHLYGNEMDAISQAGVNSGDNHPHYKHVYRLNNGRYVSAGYSAFVSVYANGKGSTDTFLLTAGSVGPYVLRIGNGNWAGMHRVSNAQIWVNGVQVVSPGTVNDETNVLTIPLTGVIRYRNLIKVEINGAPSSKLAVSIEDHTSGLKLPDSYFSVNGGQ